MGSEHTRLVACAAISNARGDVAELGDLAIEPSVERAVAAVRDFLGRDVAYATGTQFCPDSARALLDVLNDDQRPGS
jgi:hypothetical protein